MTISFYDKIYTLFTGNMEIPGDIQLESVSLIFPWKGHAAGLVLLPLFVGTIFHAKWKAAEYHPSPSPNCYAPIRQNNIFPLSFQFSPVHPTFLLHFQTRTLCSAMRRQMAIQLFIARMGSWIWQDIHARKLCKRVRTNHRTDSTYLTLEYSFVCIVPIFIQLPTKRKYPKLRHQIPPYTKQAAHVISFTDRIRRRSTSSKSRKVSPIRWNWSWRLFSTRRKVSPPPNCRCAGMLWELFSICLVFN